MAPKNWVWRTPPGWPEPPPGWQPPTGWGPDPQWPPAPPGWEFWALQADELATSFAIDVRPPCRRDLLWETWAVMGLFLFPGVMSAVLLVVRHALTGSSPDPLTSAVAGHDLAGLILGILIYLVVAAPVPIALLLLWRTGQRPSDLGLAMPGLRSDLWPALGLIGASLAGEVALALPFLPLYKDHPALANPATTGHVPAYYILFGLAVAATTALAEEVLVNGYLLVRLSQFGWTPRSALILSVALRTSYHVYYGFAFIITIPFGYFMTRSFQKRGRLTRPIVAHFLWDATLFTIAVLTS